MKQYTIVPCTVVYTGGKGSFDSVSSIPVPHVFEDENYARVVAELANKNNGYEFWVVVEYRDPDIEYPDVLEMISVLTREYDIAFYERDDLYYIELSYDHETTEYDNVLEALKEAYRYHLEQ